VPAALRDLHIRQRGIAQLLEVEAAVSHVSGQPHQVTAAVTSPDPRDRAVAEATKTLAGTLLAAGAGESWLGGRLAGTRVIAQPHCHQHAVIGYEADQAVLRAAGSQVDTLAGCCGLAGNFGMERGHYELPVAVAERSLLPALRADPSAGPARRRLRVAPGEHLAGRDRGPAEQ
jgi:Fe-S oxidoreductase